MHRLFVALRPPLALRQGCLDAMARGPAGWAWQDDDQFHLTLRYIGEVERPLAEDIAAALEGFRGTAPTVALEGVGWFDHGSRGALFARVGPRPPLQALHDRVDRLLVRLGLEPERRAYLPHITLARARRGGEDPQYWIEARAGLSSEPARIDHLTLYESHLGREGARYEPVLRVPLSA
ncbi:RNA 2',3'-cyclic phosphodiesterase [Sphingomonas sp. ASV193]|uniref:RNA 2',3'-cyclic phosphodiesterase n=1 Tax=Sphingomonas sp. ASV193 TaxID=3144405 RepID=UPI0032E91889